MSKANDGGPAFPALYPIEDETGRLGMSLRDWFAGQALAGLLANPTLREWESAACEAGDPDAMVQVCALMAFKQADAILAEREKGGGE